MALSGWNSCRIPIIANNLDGSIWQISYIGTIICRGLGCAGSRKVMRTGGTLIISRYWMSGMSEGGASALPVG